MGRTNVFLLHWTEFLIIHLEFYHRLRKPTCAHTSFYGNFIGTEKFMKIGQIHPKPTTQKHSQQLLRCWHTASYSCSLFSLHTRLLRSQLVTGIMCEGCSKYRRLLFSRYGLLTYNYIKKIECRATFRLNLIKIWQKCAKWNILELKKSHQSPILSWHVVVGDVVTRWYVDAP